MVHWERLFHCLVATQGLTLKRHIDATLGQGKVREAVCLPPGEDLNEWLAVNTVDFYNAISVLYSTLDECCTASSCPIMSAGPKVLNLPCTLTVCWLCSWGASRKMYMQYEYLWADGVKVKKPLRLTAPEYINALCDWIESQASTLSSMAIIALVPAHCLGGVLPSCMLLMPLPSRLLQMDDASIFPQHYGEPFPPTFQVVICAIFKRLFRVYAHIYHSHFKHVCALDAEAHLNTCFKHFMYFTEVGPPLSAMLCA